MKEPHILKKPTKSAFEIDQDKMVTALVEQSTNLTQISASGIFPLKCPIKQLKVNSYLGKLEMYSQFSLNPLFFQEIFPTPQFKSINSSALSFLHSPTLTSIHDHWKNHSLD